MKRKKPARKRDYKAEYARRKKTGKPRDYKREYKAKRKREILVIIRRDAMRVFGRLPKLGMNGTGNSDPNEQVTGYQMVLSEMAQRKGVFDWLDEHAFVEQLKSVGFSVDEAYHQWFSPG